MREVFKDVEYLDIVKGQRTLINFSADEVNGKSQREVELKIGEQLGEGIFPYSMKVKGNVKKQIGKIRGVVIGEAKKNMTTTTEKDILSLIEKKFSSNNSNEILTLTKQLYEARIDHYKEMNEDYKKELKELKIKYSELEEKYKKFLDEEEPVNNTSFLDSLKPFLPAIAKKFGLIETEISE